MLKSQYKDFVSGLSAALSTTLITYPLNKIIFRQILDGFNAERVLIELRAEGPLLLYRGVLPPLTQKMATLSMMFGSYNLATQSFERFHMNRYAMSLCSSTVSGTLEAFLMPFERIQILLVHPQFYNKFRNTVHAFSKVKKQYGLKEYYRGFSLIWIRNVSSSSVFFLARNEMMGFLAARERYRPLSNFLCGGVLGMVMSVLFYPIKTIKVLMHRELGTPFLTIRQAVIKTYEKEGKGMRNFSKGISLNTFRAVISWGLTNMMYEFVNVRLT